MKKDSIKVLYVEDSDIWRRFVETELSDTFDVTTAATVVQGMKELKNKEWDFVILDYILDTDVAAFNGTYLVDLVKCPYTFFTSLDDLEMEFVMTKGSLQELKALKEHIKKTLGVK